MSDLLVTVLPGHGELQATMSDVLPELPTGSLWVDLTSGDPWVTRVLADAAGQRGIDAVSAPMGGSVAEATSGTLTFFTAGSPAAVDRARPVLEALAAPGGIRLAGERPEDAQSAKLLVNALWFANAAAAGEALLLGQSLGLAPGHLRALLAESAGAIEALDEHFDALLDGDYLPTFGVDRIVEELETVRQLAADADVHMPSLDTSAHLQDPLEAYGPILGELLGVRLTEDRARHRLRRPARPEDWSGPDERDVTPR